MGYKQIDQNMTFAEVSLLRSMEHNRSLKRLEKINQVINWSRFVLSTDLTPASVHDSTYLPFCVAASCHTEDPIEKVYADKGYYGEPNSGFLHMNGIADDIMRKDTRSTKLTDYEKERVKGISKKRYS